MDAKQGGVERLKYGVERINSGVDAVNTGVDTKKPGVETLYTFTIPSPYPSNRRFFRPRRKKQRKSRFYRIGDSCELLFASLKSH